MGLRPMRLTPPTGIMNVANSLEKRGLARRRIQLSAQENIALVRRFLEARAKRDLDAMDEILAPNFVQHALAPGQQLDREGLKHQVAGYAGVFSDVRFVIEEQVAAGDKVVSRISGRGTHVRSDLLGTTPTGREIASMAIFIHRIVEGKISEEWGAGTGLSQMLGQRLEQEIRERERVEQELRVARSIQQASLPTEVPTLESWQIAPYYQPAREVGGDFFDFFDLEDGRVGVAVGDATGKGMPAALAVMASCSMVRAVAQAFGSSSPGEILYRVNDTLVARIPPNMFVTCFYAVLEPESGLLRYANAGHNLPYRLHEHAVSDLSARGMPLGLMPGMSYDEEEIVLAAGDCALFYTDGLVEAHNPRGEMFGTPRLRELLSEHPMDGADLKAVLMEELERFTGEGWEQEDDITLLTLERSTT
jgi:serine phosphatase RsbU (regulator of sigma subunit)/ketosteroid isomerase-like protein